MVICLDRGADLHTAQLKPLPLIVSCFSKIQIDFTFLVPAHPGSPGQRAVKCVCVCVCVSPQTTLTSDITASRYINRFRYFLAEMLLSERVSYQMIVCFPGHLA